MEWRLFRVNTAVLAVVVICSDENDNKKRESGMTGHWRDRAATSFQCQKKPASDSRGMVVSNHPLASAKHQGRLIY